MSHEKCEFFALHRLAEFPMNKALKRRFAAHEPKVRKTEVHSSFHAEMWLRETIERAIDAISNRFVALGPNRRLPAKYPDAAIAARKAGIGSRQAIARPTVFYLVFNGLTKSRSTPKLNLANLNIPEHADLLYASKSKTFLLPRNTLSSATCTILAWSVKRFVGSSWKLPCPNKWPLTIYVSYFVPNLDRT